MKKASNSLKKMLWVVAAVLVMSPAMAVTTLAAQQVTVYLNGSRIVYDVPPEIISSSTMVPIAFTVEQLTGSMPTFEPNTKTMTFFANGRTVVHRIGTKIVTIDGVAREYTTPSLIRDGRTLVPVRMLADATSCEVNWDASSKSVRMTGRNTSTTKPTQTPKPTQPKPSSTPSIHSISPASTSIKPGTSVTLTVTANKLADYMTVECGGATSKKITAYTSASNGNRTFTYSFVPNILEGNTGKATVHVFNSSGATISSSASITVQSKPVSPEIYSVTPDSTYITLGESVGIDIATNEGVTKVTFKDSNGKTGTAEYVRTTSGTRYYRVNSYTPTKSASVTVTITAANGNGVTAAKTCNISINAPAPTPSTAPAITSISADDAVNGVARIYVETNMATSYITVSGSSVEDYDIVVNGSPVGDTRTFQVDVISYSAFGSKPVTVEAFNDAGKSVAKTVHVEFDNYEE